MNFGVIFLCLLIGAVIGFEVGKYMTQKKISEMLSKFSEDLTKKAKEREEKREKIQRDFDKAMDDILNDLRKSRAAGDTDGDKEIADLIRNDIPLGNPDVNNRSVRPVYLNKNDRGDEA